MPNSALTGLQIDPRVTHLHLQRMQDQKAVAELDPKMAAAAQDFEAMFLADVIRPMFDSIDVDEQFGGGKGEEVFRGMLSDEYGKIMAKSGGIGLASPVKDALLRAQAAQK